MRRWYDAWMFLVMLLELCLLWIFRQSHKMMHENQSLPLNLNVAFIGDLHLEEFKHDWAESTHWNVAKTRKLGSFRKSGGFRKSASSLH